MVHMHMVAHVWKSTCKIHDQALQGPGCTTGGCRRRRRRRHCPRRRCCCRPNQACQQTSTACQSWLGPCKGQLRRSAASRGCWWPQRTPRRPAPTQQHPAQLAPPLQLVCARSHCQATSRLTLLAFAAPQAKSRPR